MRLNQHTALRGSRVLLVPYMRQHVATYHTWMSDPEILRLTASEPLSLDEELLNQRSWLLDPTKLTFIVTDRDDPSLLLGDVNLYLHPHFDAGHAEVAVMIANPDARRSGCACESLRLLMHYAAINLGVQFFVAKIDHDNHPSRFLFQKLGFTADGVDPANPALLGEPNVFGEVELRLVATSVLTDTVTIYKIERIERDDLPDDDEDNDADHTLADSQNANQASSSLNGSASVPNAATSAILQAVDTAAKRNSE
jgi:RimJ/RimL family protein N-acetyltransferase